MRITILTIAIQAEHDLVLVRQRCRQLAEQLGLDTNRQTRLATAVSEISRNAFQYAGGGKAELIVDRDGGHLMVRVSDSGPGIGNLQKVLSGNYRSETGLGLGLVGARRLVDGFEIQSSPGAGTTVILKARIPGEVPEESELLSHVDELTRTPSGDPFREVLQQNQELMRAQTALAEANRDLEHSQQAKDRFLAMLAHELRNLLNALRSSMEVLKRQPDEEIRGRMEQIADLQVEHLGRLVNDLLDVSRIIRGTLELRPIPVDAGEEIRRTAVAWGDRITGCGRKLTTEIPEGPIWVTADPTRLAQIIGNLLSNARKFTDVGGEIQLAIESGPEQARIRVIDDGCGMKKDQLDEVFSAFAQTSEAKERMTGGLGLGLAITRALAEAHGGSLSAESAGPGMGTTMILELPLGRPPVEEGDDAPVSETTSLVRRILLVDDHQPSIQGLSELLRLEGHEVELAEDGPQALDLVQEFEPDVVLCDLGLPGMTGHEVARKLRESQTAARLLALTGYVDVASRKEALEAGFEAVLAKPIDLQLLNRHLLTH